VPLLRALGVPVAAGAAVAFLAAARLVLTGAGSAFLQATMFTIVRSQMDAFNSAAAAGVRPASRWRRLLLPLRPGGLFGAMFQGDPLATTTTISAVIRCLWQRLPRLGARPASRLAARPSSGRARSHVRRASSSRSGCCSSSEFSVDHLVASGGRVSRRCSSSLPRHLARHLATLERWSPRVARIRALRGVAPCSRSSSY
jgi:hypothetical protein